MNEEMTNNEMELFEETDMEVTELVPVEEEGGSLAGTIVKGIVVVGGAALVGLAVKNRKKFAEWRDKKAMERLQKRGYVTLPANQESDVVDEVDDEIEE